MMKTFILTGTLILCLFVVALMISVRAQCQTRSTRENDRGLAHHELELARLFHLHSPPTADFSHVLHTRPNSSLMHNDVLG